MNFLYISGALVHGRGAPKQKQSLLFAKAVLLFVCYSLFEKSGAVVSAPPPASSGERRRISVA